MATWQRTVGQVLLAVGGLMALGGIASFLYPKVELRFLGNVFTAPEERIAWVLVNVLIASLRFWLMRRRSR